MPASSVRRRERRNPSTATAAVPARPRPRIATSSSLLFFALFAALAAAAVTFLVLRRPIEKLQAKIPLDSVYDRGLVKADVSYLEILQEHDRVSTGQRDRRFTGPVLAYVTPWNAKGYEMAQKFNFKFSYISPVWYELKSEGEILTLEGQHNVDIGWISGLRKTGKSLVVPRFVLEAYPAYILEKKQQAEVISLIVQECKDFGYDGIVLESWSRWAMYGVLQDANLRSLALQFVKQLGEALHSASLNSSAGHSLELIFVIPAPRTEKLAEHDFGPKDLQALSTAVDGFSLMTYDFSGPQNPGPNAPLKWIRSSLDVLLADKSSAFDGLARKIFVGINFYGNDFALNGGPSGNAILGGAFISLLKKHRPSFRWEEKSSEHYFIYSVRNVKHAVFFPSLKSISARLDEAREWGAGLSIWEIGQGLDYFFDLL